MFLGLSQKRTSFQLYFLKYHAIFFEVEILACLEGLSRNLEIIGIVDFLGRHRTFRLLSQVKVFCKTSHLCQVGGPYLSALQTGDRAVSGGAQGEGC